MSRSLTLIFGVISIQAQVAFNDAAFESFCISNYDTDMNMEISMAEAAAVTGVMNCSNLGITDLTGLEAFINVENLNCADNLLTWLPSLPPPLLTLRCNNNPLESLPTLPSLLGTLVAYQCQLTSLPAIPSSVYALIVANNRITRC